MPFALFIVGALLLAASLKGKTRELMGIAKDDFTGNNSFFLWVFAVGVIVAAGNIDDIKLLSNIFLVLVVIVMLLSNKGFLPQFSREVKKGFS